MLSGIQILGSGMEQYANPMNPDTVLQSHPLWEKDVKEFGPWDMVDSVEQGIGSNVELWRSSVDSDDPVLVLGRCSSTMDVARKMYEAGLAGDWTSFMAVEQDGGRGQLRRHWWSPPGNLYVSIIWPKLPNPDEDGDWKSILSLVLGNLVCEALRETGYDAAQKWPNDIYIDGRKVCGILIDEKGDRIIAGIGINLASTPPLEFIRNNASEPGLLGLNSPSPLGLWQKLENRVKNGYECTVRLLSPSVFISKVSNRLMWLGKRVSVHESDQFSYHARIVGLSKDGGLRICKDDGRTITLYSGSVSPLNRI